MSHSFNKIWIHAIWSTKDRFPLVKKDIEENIYQYITQQLNDNGCQVKIINGMPDHIHCLFLMNPLRSIADIIKQIKGSSSHYINQNNLISEKFAWQTGYSAFSVSESVVEKVFQYIINQKEHHQKKSFQDEYNDFLKVYGLKSE